MSGYLYIIATPVGNLKDISTRVKEAISGCDVVFAEDTRVTERLLRHLGLSKPLVSCHDFNEARRAETLTRHADAKQSVALVSDAGTPLISDPGYKVVREAIRLGMAVVPIPGPSAALLALVGSGLPCDRFAFEGFLPEHRGDRRRRLMEIRHDRRTLVFFAAAHDIKKILPELAAELGDRPACVARELTKIHEEFLRGTLTELDRELSSRDRVRGECVIVVAGSSDKERTPWSEDNVRRRLSELLAGGARLKEASSVLAAESGWSASRIYKLGLSMPPDQKVR